MGNRSRYRKLPDLYVVGTEVVFDTDEGPLVMWCQVLTPFEQQECRNDAQAARARLVMALSQPDSQDYRAAKSSYLQRGKTLAVQDLASLKYSDWYLAARAEVEDDPEWAERMTILRNSDTPAAMPLSDEEQAVLAGINGDFNIEVGRRTKDSQDFYIEQMGKAPDDEVLNDYLEAWRDNRGQNLALVEYNASEILYGARVCDAKPDSEGKFERASHDACNQHRERVFEDRSEVVDLPEEMQIKIRDAFDSINMSVREAKNSARQGSSSDSSPLPSKEEESTPSTPIETPQVAPGT